MEIIVENEQYNIDEDTPLNLNYNQIRNQNNCQDRCFHLGLMIVFLGVSGYLLWLLNEIQN